MTLTKRANYTVAAVEELAVDSALVIINYLQADSADGRDSQYKLYFLKYQLVPQKFQV